jgi:hypothetical protein
MAGTEWGEIGVEEPDIVGVRRRPVNPGAGCFTTRVKRI